MALNWRASALIEMAQAGRGTRVFRSRPGDPERYAPSDVPAPLGNIAVTLAALGRFDEAVAAGREATADRRAGRQPSASQHVRAAAGAWPVLARRAGTRPRRRR